MKLVCIRQDDDGMLSVYDGASDEADEQPAQSVDEALDMARGMLSDERSADQAVADGYAKGKPKASAGAPLAAVFGE